MKQNVLLVYKISSNLHSFLEMYLNKQLIIIKKQMKPDNSTVIIYFCSVSHEQKERKILVKFVFPFRTNIDALTEDGSSCVTCIV